MAETAHFSTVAREIAAVRCVTPYLDAARRSCVEDSGDFSRTGHTGRAKIRVKLQIFYILI